MKSLPESNAWSNVTEPDPPSPSSLVKVEINVGDPTYLRLAVMLSGEDTERWWTDLGDLLYGRPGWYCEILPGMHMVWSFGAVGASLFNISYDHEPGYAVFDWESDTTTRFRSINELRNWLEENEGRHAEHPRKLRALASTSNWAVLQQLGFDLDVRIDKGIWIASVRKLPVTTSTGLTLAAVLSDMRGAIAYAFDAPSFVASGIQVRVHLDEAAAAALPG